MRLDGLTGDKFWWLHHQHIDAWNLTWRIQTPGTLKFMSGFHGSENCGC